MIPHTAHNYALPVDRKKNAPAEERRSVDNYDGKRIEINFDTRINGYAVTMPDFITLDMIEEWKV